MQRPILMIAAILPLLAGCRDGPHAITAPDEAAAILEHQEAEAALFAVWDILDDPFVRELVEVLGVDERAFQKTARDMTAVHVLEDLRELSETLQLTAPRSPEREAGDEVLKAALDLILDDAARVAASHFEDETSPAGPVGRHIEEKP